MPQIDINPNTIRVKTAAQWAADATIYSERTLLVTSDATFTGTDFRKIKLADGVQTWAQLNYLPIDEIIVILGSLQSQINNLGLTELLLVGNTTGGTNIKTSDGDYIEGYDGNKYVQLGGSGLLNDNLIVGSDTVIELNAPSVKKNGIEIVSTDDSRLSDTRYIKALAKSQTYNSHTGNTNNTKIYSVLIPANTFQVGDFINITLFTSKNSSANPATIRQYFNNTDDLTSPQLIGTATIGTTNTYTQQCRTLFVRSAAETLMISASNSAVIDITSSNNGYTTENIDWTINQYFIVAGQLGVSGDTIAFESAYITITR